MSKEKVIIFLTPAFPSHEQDWNWLPVLQRLALSIKTENSGLKLKIISFSYPHKTLAYQWNGIDVFPYNMLHQSKFDRLVSWIRIWQLLLNLKSKYEISSIFSFWIGETSFIGSWFAWLFQIRFYAWICGQDAKPGNRFVSYSKLNDQNTIAISDFIQTTFLKNYQIQTFRTIPFGVEKTITAKNFSERSIDILGVGSLKPLKQFHLFIEVIAIIKNTYPNIHVKICGSGESKLELIHQIKELQLENNIQLLGEVMHHENLQMMSDCKILLHCSNYEGLSAACLEALEAGCHVISFVQSMNQEILQWQIANSVQDKADIALSILNNPAAYSKNVMPFSIVQTAASVIELSAL